MTQAPPNPIKRQGKPRSKNASSAPVIDTSGMNAAQAEALTVAEAARDSFDPRSGFGGQLFLGKYRPSLIEPFPNQDADDQKIGDALVAKVSGFLIKNLDPEEVDATRTIPESVMAGLQELGVMRMKVPREYGGLGLSQVNYNRVIQAIASYCGSTAVLVSAHQSIGIPAPIKMCGTVAQKREFLTRIADGAISAFALTEPGVGSDPAKLTTTAELSEDGSHYILNGIKQWCTNGPIADLIVVMARTAPKVIKGKERQQITAFVVEGKAEGVETLHRCDFMGIRGIQNGLMKFTNVKVPVENVILGEGKGLKMALKTLNVGRLTLPAACTGMAKQCLTIARDWGAEREQWGQPIGKHEAGAEKVAWIAANTFAMDAVWRATSGWADQERDLRIEAAMAKLFSSERSWEIVDKTLQLRGGRGYETAASLKARGEKPYPVERMMRECRINTIIEGTSEIMHLYLAREALDPHLRAAGALINSKSTLAEKLASAAKAGSFYAAWYPQRVFGAFIPSFNRSPLAKQRAYIARTTNRTAAMLFHAMAANGPKLERRQALLGLLMDSYVELFAMAAACSYAESECNSDHQDQAIELANDFCRFGRTRIRSLLHQARHANRKHERKLSKNVLAGRHQWLESGVIECQQA